VAPEQVLEQGFQAARAFQDRLDFLDFAMSEFSPAGASRRIVAEAVEEQLYLAERGAHFAGEADQEHAVESLTGIAALTAGAPGRRKKTEFFIVADRGSVEAGAKGWR
jgi:hypothetical protein